MNNSVDIFIYVLYQINVSESIHYYLIFDKWTGRVDPAELTRGRVDPRAEFTPGRVNLVPIDTPRANPVFGIFVERPILTP